MTDYFSNAHLGLSTKKDNNGVKDAKSSFMTCHYSVNRETGSWMSFTVEPSTRSRPYTRLHWILFPDDKAVLIFSEMTVSQILVPPYVNSQEREKHS